MTPDLNPPKLGFHGNNPLLFSPRLSLHLRSILIKVCEMPKARQPVSWFPPDCQLMFALTHGQFPSISPSHLLCAECASFPSICFSLCSLNHLFLSTRLRRMLQSTWWTQLSLLVWRHVKSLLVIANRTLCRNISAAGKHIFPSWTFFNVHLHCFKGPYCAFGGFPFL